MIAKRTDSTFVLWCFHTSPAAAILDYIDGGYIIQNHPSIDTIPEAKKAFVRALNKWRCTTGYNADYPDTLQFMGSNGGCLIEFSDIPIGTQSTSRAITIASPEPCNDDMNIGYLRSFRMKFNENIDWYYGTNTPSFDWIEYDAAGNIVVVRGDIESTALHELGHAHLLLHTCNLPATNLMYSPGPNDYRRTITENAELGGHHIMNRSGTITAANCSQDGIVKVLSQDCEIILTGTKNFKHSTEVTLYPNPTHHKLFIKGLDKLTGTTRLEIYDALGQLKKTYANTGMRDGLDIELLPSGLYMLVARGRQDYLLGQFVIR